ncbi:immunity 22 family protein [Bacillus inaquosorum]|uniref:immunity 22 family protein n=1 Tax=Bacillus inaquosorum TaxID=483913 RepID=UPI00105DE394|nr:immunity 22 family protein [Bacillus inaquosorum]TDO08411.1 immunity protein 22 of polymorphic toxin system [Bacillus subtilis]MCY7962948.1 immunity 22 family protein [Bacillus inaquosorum]MCY7976501.1 immunity 22 family protein [Bacillus inaquosorum]MCY8138214.1 immunity 22 family protein [Bacillus inaquosorum]MCY8164819.1 immunity 22 family protein [Bacillus inaquosorum]
MERQNFVSLWIGSINDDESLSKYVELDYNEDEGDFLPSQFLIDFDIDIDDLDEDFIEKVAHKKTCNNLSTLIGGCSYDSVILPRFENMVGTTIPEQINAAVLLYNFEYDGREKEINAKNYSFKFIGAVPYV